MVDAITTSYTLRAWAKFLGFVLLALMGLYYISPIDLHVYLAFWNNQVSLGLILLGLALSLFGI